MDKDKKNKEVIKLTVPKYNLKKLKDEDSKVTLRGRRIS